MQIFRCLLIGALLALCAANLRGAESSVLWVDDVVPTGATSAADGGDAWNWVSSNPAPFSGSLASQSSISPGEHQIFFNGATDTLAIDSGDVLFAYVYLDPNHLPTEVMLQWNDGTWDHRAFWGANNISYGDLGTTSRYYVGPLPSAGQWVRLEVPASRVGLEGSILTGMAFSLFDGAAAWDAAGKTSGSIITPPSTDTIGPSVTMTAPGNNEIISGSTVKVSADASDNVGVVGIQFKIDGVNIGSEVTTAPYTATLNTTLFLNGSHAIAAIARDAASNRGTSAVVNVLIGNVVVPPNTNNDVVWFDDDVPTGAVTGADGGDAWTWFTSNPAPFSGATAHQSSFSSGTHQHFFNYAGATLMVSTGESLVAYVYLDPINPPSEIMLQWNNGSWEHRAYWGANLNTFGVDGTPSRRYIGVLPSAGQWTRLEVPAKSVGLEGSTLKGMSFTLTDGQATWDHVGKQTFPKASIQPIPFGMTITWPSTPGQTYRVLYKVDWADPNWYEISGPITANTDTTSWDDISTDFDTQRFYQIVQ